MMIVDMNDVGCHLQSKEDDDADECREPVESQPKEGDRLERTRVADEMRQHSIRTWISET